MSSYHGWTHRTKTKGGTDPIGPGPATLHIKVFPDEFFDVSFPVTFGDYKFICDASRDMDGMVLVDAEAYVTTVSSAGYIQTGAINLTQSTTLAILQIDEGEKNSGTSGTAPDIPGNDVNWMDEIMIFVDSPGADAFGLGVILIFE